MFSCEESTISLSCRTRTRQTLLFLLQRPGRSLELHNRPSLRPPRKPEFRPGCCFLCRLKAPLRLWRQTETPQMRRVSVSASVFALMKRSQRTEVSGYLPTPGPSHLLTIFLIKHFSRPGTPRVVTPRSVQEHSRCESNLTMDYSVVSLTRPPSFLFKFRKTLEVRFNMV